MESINPQGWLRAPGWSHGVKAKLGDQYLVKIAGQVGWDMTNQQIVSADLVEQYGQALKNICTILEEAGGGPNSIMEMRIYARDLEEFNSRAKELGKTYVTHIGKHFPAMTLIGVKDLFNKDVQIEIEATAIV